MSRKGKSKRKKKCEEVEEAVKVEEVKAVKKPEQVALLPHNIKQMIYMATMKHVATGRKSKVESEAESKVESEEPEAGKKRKMPDTEESWFDVSATFSIEENSIDSFQRTAVDLVFIPVSNVGTSQSTNGIFRTIELGQLSMSSATVLQSFNLSLLPTHAGRISFNAQFRSPPSVNKAQEGIYALIHRAPLSTSILAFSRPIVFCANPTYTKAAFFFLVFLYYNSYSCFKKDFNANFRTHAAAVLHHFSSKALAKRYTKAYFGKSGQFSLGFRAIYGSDAGAQSEQAFWTTEALRRWNPSHPTNSQTSLTPSSSSTNDVSSTPQNALPPSLNESVSDDHPLTPSPSQTTVGGLDLSKSHFDLHDKGLYDYDWDQFSYAASAENRDYSYLSPYHTQTTTPCPEYNAYIWQSNSLLQDELTRDDNFSPRAMDEVATSPFAASAENRDYPYPSPYHTQTTTPCPEYNPLTSTNASIWPPVQTAGHPVSSYSPLLQDELPQDENPSAQAMYELKAEDASSRSASSFASCPQFDNSTPIKLAYLMKLLSKVVDAEMEHEAAAYDYTPRS